MNPHFNDQAYHNGHINLLDTQLIYQHNHLHRQEVALNQLQMQS